MTRTVWLASYPKSGNTWFRLFIANLLHPGKAPVHFNDLPVMAPIASSRAHFDRLLGVPSTLLTPEEIESLRPSADRELACEWQEPLLLRKVHDAYVRLLNGSPMLGSGADFAAIYFLRDPWDVAPSFANHMACSLDEAVEELLNPDYVMAHSRAGASSQLAQRLLSWAEHAVSWVEAPLALHLMRYEDMRLRPVPTFRGAVRFLGFENSDAEIEAALEACRIERMQEQEAETRFLEAPRDTRRFFRSGRVGEGLETLSAAQLDRLRAAKIKVERAIAARHAAA